MKKEEIDIFKVAKKAGPPKEEEALDNAIYALQVYLDMIKNDNEKILEFVDSVDILFRDAKKSV